MSFYDICLFGLFSDLRNHLDIAETKVRQLQSGLEDKEREAVQRVQAAREDEFSKMAAVENEKYVFISIDHYFEIKKLGQ